MKVLLIDVNCKGSSTGKIVYDLYTSLRSDGHDVGVCYGRGNIVNEENIFKFGLDWETKLHGFLARLTGLNGYFSYFSTKRLLNFIEEFNPDVVHIHELHAYFVNFRPLLKYLKSKGIKVVWTFHCEYMYTGKCGHANECENWKQSCGNCPAVKGYPKSLYFDFTKKMFKDKKELLCNMDFTVVTPSKWLADRVKSSFLCNKKITIIHNGIETNTIFYPRAKADVDLLKRKYNFTNKRIILSVAPNIMSDSKGGKTVLGISKCFADENIQFVLVGADENKNVGDNVTLIKRTANQDELALWYSAADLFLICSKKETFSMTCAEAMCCGTLIAGLNSGAPETIFSQPYAMFCSPDKIENLKGLIRKQLDSNFDKQVIAKIGKELYSKENMYKNYLELYEG